MNDDISGEDRAAAMDEQVIAPPVTDDTSTTERPAEQPLVTEDESRDIVTPVAEVDVSGVDVNYADPL